MMSLNETFRMINTGYFPCPNDCIHDLQDRADRFNRCRDKEDALAAERQAKIHFVKVLTLKRLSDDLHTEGKIPLPVSEDTVQCAIKSCTKKTPYIFLTVNPQKDITLTAFMTAVNKFLKKKSITHYFGVYEVRKAETGLHAHILVSQNSPFYDFKRSTKNTFKNICNTENSNILNFKNISEELLPDKINYMLGGKKDAKLQGVQDTITYREKYSINPYYESVDPFPCRSTPKIVD